MKHYLELLTSFIINTVPWVFMYFLFIDSGFIGNFNNYLVEEVKVCPAIQ